MTASEKIQPELRERLKEEIGSLKQAIKAHATEKKRVQDIIIRLEVVLVQWQQGFPPHQGQH